MPILANAKHEKFAQAIASGVAGTPAWLAVSPRSKPESAAVSASRLLRDAKVSARIAELNAPAIAALETQAEEAVATAAWIVARAVEIVQIGMATTPVRDRKGEVIEDAQGQPAYYDTTDLKAANSALALLAKRHPEFRDAQPTVEVKVLVVGEGRL